MSQIDQLVMIAELKGLLPHTKPEMIRKIAPYFWWANSWSENSGFNLLRLLRGPNQKIDLNSFTNNIAANISEFFPETSLVPFNSAYQETLAIILDTKGKGYGGGELFLELYSTDGKGETNLIEVKNLETAASIKVNRVDEVRQKITDEQNKKFWGGKVPGQKNLQHHSTIMAILQNHADPKTHLKNYFEKIYPNDCNKIFDNPLFDDLLKKHDPKEWQQTLGKILLEVVFDKFGYEKIIFFDPKREKIIVLCDPSDHKFIDEHLILKPMLKRRNDTQATTDGFLNVVANRN